MFQGSRGDLSRLERSSWEVKASKRWPRHVPQCQLQEGVSRRTREHGKGLCEPKASVLFLAHKDWHCVTFAPLTYSLM